VCKPANGGALYSVCCQPTESECGDFDPVRQWLTHCCTQLPHPAASMQLFVEQHAVMWTSAATSISLANLMAAPTHLSAMTIPHPQASPHGCNGMVASMLQAHKLNLHHDILYRMEAGYNCENGPGDELWKCCLNSLNVNECIQLGTDQHCSDCSPCPTGKKCAAKVGGGFECVCETSGEWQQCALYGGCPCVHR